MSNKKTTLILLLLGVVSLISGFILMFVSNIKKEQKELNDRIQPIKEGYDKFSTELKKINELRDQIHKDFLDKIYYDTFEQNHTEYKKRLIDYEKKVTDLYKQNKKMATYCGADVYYSSIDANSKCQSFNLAMEQMINSFVDDINMYNKNIDDYNQYLVSKNNTTSPKLEKYQTEKKYIDFNHDGDYTGKEEGNKK